MERPSSWQFLSSKSAISTLEKIGQLKLRQLLQRFGMVVFAIGSEILDHRAFRTSMPILWRRLANYSSQYLWVGKRIICIHFLGHVPQAHNYPIRRRDDLVLRKEWSFAHLSLGAHLVMLTGLTSGHRRSFSFLPLPPMGNVKKFSQLMLMTAYWNQSFGSDELSRAILQDCSE